MPELYPRDHQTTTDPEDCYADEAAKILGCSTLDLLELIRLGALRANPDGTLNRQALLLWKDLRHRPSPDLAWLCAETFVRLRTLEQHVVHLMSTLIPGSVVARVDQEALGTFCARVRFLCDFPDRLTEQDIQTTTRVWFYSTPELIERLITIAGEEKFHQKMLVVAKQIGDRLGARSPDQVALFDEARQRLIRACYLALRGRAGDRRATEGSPDPWLSEHDAILTELGYMDRTTRP